MKRNLTWNMRMGCLLIGILVLCSTAALASQLPGPAYHTFDSYQLRLPAGIVLASESYDPQTGWLRLVVDSEKSDFGLALSTDYDAGYSAMLFRGNMTADASLTGARETMSFSPASDAHIQEMLTNFRSYEANFGKGWGNTASWTWFMGSYDEREGVFFPENNTFGNVVVWEKDDANPYLLLIDLRYTNTEPVKASMQKLPAQNIMPDYHQVLTSDDSAVAKDGYIRYTRSGTNAVELTTGYTVPGMQAGWSVYELMGGQEKEASAVDVTPDGQPIYQLTWPTWYQTGDCVKETSYSIQCRDENQVIRAAYQLSISIVQGEKKPWPEYAGSDPEILQPIHAMTTDRFQTRLVNGFDGVSLSYQNGVLTQKVDNAKLIEAESTLLENVRIETSLTPPPGAVCYAVRSTGGQVVFGPENVLYYDEPDASLRVAINPGAVLHGSYMFFRSVAYSQGQQEYYRSALEYTTDLGGMVPLYFWYDSLDATEPMLVEYFVRMAEPVELQSRTTVLGDVADIPKGQEDKPFIVIAGFGDKGKNYTFQAQMYPAGENSRYFELQLLDHKGHPTALPALGAERYTVYIPHPKGVALEGLSFYVTHYGADGETVKDLYAFDHPNPRLRLYHAPNGKGFCFEVSSLSPFVLTWDEPQAPAPLPAGGLPKTGDSFPLAALLAAGCISLALAAWLSRRFKRA